MPYLFRRVVGNVSIRVRRNGFGTDYTPAYRTSSTPEARCAVSWLMHKARLRLVNDTVNSENASRNGPGSHPARPIGFATSRTTAGPDIRSSDLAAHLIHRLDQCQYDPADYWERPRCGGIYHLGRHGVSRCEYQFPDYHVSPVRLFRKENHLACVSVSGFACKCHR